MSISWTIVITLCALVATCGHKGPLQLPEAETNTLAVSAAIGELQL